MRAVLRNLLVGAAFVAAAANAIAAPLAAFANVIDERTFHVLAYGSASVIVALFVWMLLDPESHRAINAANREMQGDEPFKFRMISWFDKDWGLFVAKGGGRLLPVLRLVLFIEFLVALVAMHRAASLFDAAPLVFAVAGFAITVELTLDQLKDHYKPALDERSQRTGV